MLHSNFVYIQHVGGHVIGHKWQALTKNNLIQIVTSVNPKTVRSKDMKKWNSNKNI